jgi:hypothetical protein
MRRYDKWVEATTSRPLFLPLCTGVRGREILGSPPGPGPTPISAPDVLSAKYYAVAEMIVSEGKKANMTSTTSSGGNASVVRDRIAMALLLLSAAGALVSFLGSIGPALTASSDTQVVETWRAYGYLVFAGLFVLLAFRPRRFPGVWELAIFHKVALTISALTIISGAAGAGTIFVADGLVTIFLIVSYMLSRGYSAWATLRAN